MRAWLQIQIESAPPGRTGRLLQCEDFGMLHAVIGVRAYSNFAACSVHDNRAHRWIRRYQPDTRPC